MSNSKRTRNHRLALFAASAVALVGAASAVGAPTVSNPAGPSGYTTNATPEITIGSGGTGTGTFTYTVDGGPPVPASGGTITLSSLSQGEHTVEVTEAGDPTPTSVTFKVDSIAPTLGRSISPGSPNGINDWYTSAPTVTWTCFDAGSGIAASACPANATLTDGVHPLATGPVLDNAGNASNVLPALTVRVDTSDPAAPTAATPDGYTNVLRPTFTWSTVEDAAGSGFDTYLLQITPASGSPITASVPQGSGAETTYVPTADLVNNTTYTWRVRARDRAGNTGDWSNSVEVRVDTSAPDAPAITGGPRDGVATNDNTPGFTVAGAPGSTFGWETLNSAGEVVALAGAGGVGAPGPDIVLPALPDGTYTFKVNQTAVNGRTGDFATAQFSVDTTAPGVPGITERPGTSANAQPSFGWAPAEQGGTFTWEIFGVGGARVQGPANTTNTSVQVPTALAAGSYSFRVHQTDRAGNVGGWSLPEPFTITAPATNQVPTPVTPKKATRFRPQTRNAHRLFPKVGRGLWRKRVVLRWRGARGATLYNVQVFLVRGTRYTKVHSTFPRGRKVRIPWKKMKPGKRYVWRVWPYMGKKRSYSRAPLGISWFKVRVPPKQSAAAKKAAARKAAAAKAAARKAAAAKAAAAKAAAAKAN